MASQSEHSAIDDALRQMTDSALGRPAIQAAIEGHRKSLTGVKSMWHPDIFKHYDSFERMMVLDGIEPRCFQAFVGESPMGGTIHEIKAFSLDEAWRVARRTFGVHNVRHVSERKAIAGKPKQIIDYTPQGETVMPNIVAETADQYIAEETAQKTAVAKARAVEALALFLKSQEDEKARLKAVIENTKEARAKVKDRLKGADGIRDRADASVEVIKAYLKANDPNFIASHW